MLGLAKALWRPETQGQLRVYRRVRFAGKVVRDAWSMARKRRRPVAVTSMLRAWRLGFTVSSYVAYDLDRNDPSAYLPDSAVYLPRLVEGPLSRVLRDKILFSTVVGAHIRVPRVVGLVSRGKFHAVATDGASARGRDANGLDALLTLLEHHGPVIAKPAQGMAGRGVHSLAVEGPALLLDGRPTSVADVRRLLSGFDDYVVTNLLRQAGYAAQIFPGSANTIRVVTMQDPDDEHRPFVVMAGHRFGVTACAPTDNALRGGIASGIDLDSGRLGIASQHPRFGGASFAAHPDTGTRIEGTVIPGWHDALGAVLRVATELDFLRYVGWDLLMTEDGPALLEGNIPNRIIQSKHPYLADPRVRRFFELHGVV